MKTFYVRLSDFVINIINRYAIGILRKYHIRNILDMKITIARAGASTIAKTGSSNKEVIYFVFLPDDL